MLLYFLLMSEMAANEILWTVFGVVYGVGLAIELWRNRSPHEVKLREAAVESVIWVGLAGMFNGLIFWLKGYENGLQFLSGFLVEKALSVDNIFVFLLVFSAFVVPATARKRVLLWGVMGAIVMRGIMIAVGVAAVERFHFVEYIFGGVLLWTAWRMLRELRNKDDDVEDVSESWLARFLQKNLPYKDFYDGHWFVTHVDGKRALTKLALVLCVIEGTDLIFAVDSIPAVLALSRDPLIVFTSNVAAIFGLRALYFLLAHVMEQLHFIKHALIGVLGFIGVKMLLPLLHVHISIGWSLGVIVLMLTGAVVASVLKTKRDGLLNEG